MERIKRAVILLLTMTLLITGCRLQPVWAADVETIRAALETMASCQIEIL